jgi:hypothetical protein
MTIWQSAGLGGQPLASGAGSLILPFGCTAPCRPDPSALSFLAPISHLGAFRRNSRNISLQEA